MHEIDLVEFPSAQASASADFFAKVFGWSQRAYGESYLEVEGGGVNLAFQSDPAQKPSAPLVVIRSTDLDRSRAEIEAAGGEVTVEPFDFPGGSRFHFREPGGAELAVWRPADS